MAVKTYGIREIGEKVYVPMYVNSAEIRTNGDLIYTLTSYDPNVEDSKKFDGDMTYKRIDEFYTEDQLKELGEKLYKESIVVSSSYDDIGTASCKYSKNGKVIIN